MGEEAMVTGLTQDMVAWGANLIRRLDDRGLAPGAAFWVYDADREDWTLFLSEAEVKSGGPRSFYSTLRDELAKAGDEVSALTLADIAAVPPDHPLVRLLRSALRTGPGISGIRFTSNVINGTLVDDAYIYRLT